MKDRASSEARPEKDVVACHTDNYLFSVQVNKSIEPSFPVETPVRSTALILSSVHETSPLGTVGCPSQIPSPEGVGAGGGASLVPCSITYTTSVTPTKKPYEIAWQSYRNCSSIKKEKYGKLLPNFCTYMEMCDNSGFKAIGIAPGSPGNGFREINGALLNRWHPQL